MYVRILVFDGILWEEEVVVVVVRTGIPVEWIMERWVDEKVRWPASLAAENRRDTKDDRLSERPNCIVASVEDGCG